MLWAVVALGCPAVLLGAQPDFETLKAAIRSNSEKLQRVAIEGVLTTRSFAKPSDGSSERPQVEVSTMDLARSWPKERLAFQTKLPEFGFFERAICQTGKVTFTVRRDSETSGYYLENWVELPESYKVARDLKRQQLCEAVYSPYMLPHFTDYLDGEAIEVTGIRQQPYEWGQGTVLDFKITTPRASYEGSLVLDANCGWQVRESSYRLSVLAKNNKTYGIDYRSSLEYSDRGGECVPVRITGVMDRGSVRQEFEFVPTVWRLGELPDEDFSLAHFGLGQVDIGSETRGFPPPWLLVGASLVCGVLGVVLYRHSMAKARN